MLDNASGVSSLEVRLDSGTWTPVAFDANGRFTIPTQFCWAGQDDGPAASSCGRPMFWAASARRSASGVTLDAFADAGGAGAVGWRNVDRPEALLKGLPTARVPP